jgi:hypothetical protein
VLLVGLHDRTGSLLLVMLMHASLSAGTLILQPAVSGPPFAVWNLALAVVVWGVVAGAAITRRRSFLPRSLAEPAAVSASRESKRHGVRGAVA